MSRAAWALSSALLLYLPWGEAGDDPTGLAIAHLLALGALLMLPVVRRPPLGGGVGAAWLAALVVFGALQVLRPGNRFSALLEVWDQFVPALWFLAVAHAPLADPGRRRLLGILVGSAAAHAAWALGLHLLTGARTGGAFVNANFLAAHLNIALAAALWLARGRRGAGRILSIGSALLLLAALSATGSRGGLLGAVAVVALALPWQRLREAARSNPRPAAAALVALLVGSSAGAALWWNSRQLESDPYRFHRLQIWERTLSIWSASPWLGVGPGQLQWIAPAHKFPLEGAPIRYGRVWTSAHSTPLQLGAEEGIAGLLLAMGFLLALGRALAARARALHGGLERAALAALAGASIQAVFDTPFENGAVTLSLATLAGLALGPRLSGAGAEEPRRGGAQRALAARVGLAGGVALALAVWGAVLAPWMAHRALLRFQGEPEPRRALAALERALRLNPYQHAYAIQLGRIVWTARGRPDLRRVAAADSLLERASELNPHDGRAEQERGRVMTQAALTRILPATPALRAALRRYEESARRRPLDPLVRQEAGLAALRLGDLERARSEARAALALEPNFLDAWLLLADAARGGGERAAARAALVEFRAARARLEGYSPVSPYEEGLLKYNDAVFARLEGDLAP